jgi:hypothetical protein
MIAAFSGASIAILAVLVVAIAFLLVRMVRT